MMSSPSSLVERSSSSCPSVFEVKFIIKPGSCHRVWVLVLYHWVICWPRLLRPDWPHLALVNLSGVQPHCSSFPLLASWWFWLWPVDDLLAAEPARPVASASRTRLSLLCFCSRVFTSKSVSLNHSLTDSLWGYLLCTHSSQQQCVCVF